MVYIVDWLLVRLVKVLSIEIVLKEKLDVAHFLALIHEDKLVKFLLQVVVTPDILVPVDKLIN